MHIRAGRSGEDRYLGMVEAAGSIPARSTIMIKIIIAAIHTPIEHESVDMTATVTIAPITN